MRISIKKHHAQYLKNLAEQMGCDVAEALNYLLHEAKRHGTSFASPLPPQPSQPVGMFTPYQPLQPIDMPTLDPDCFEHFDQEPDEIIQKFARLLEEF